MNVPAGCGAEGPEAAWTPDAGKWVEVTTGQEKGPRGPRARPGRAGTAATRTPSDQPAPPEPPRLASSPPALWRGVKSEGQRDPPPINQPSASRGLRQTFLEPAGHVWPPQFKGNQETGEDPRAEQKP